MRKNELESILIAKIMKQLPKNINKRDIHIKSLNLDLGLDECDIDWILKETYEEVHNLYQIDTSSIILNIDWDLYFPTYSFRQIFFFHLGLSFLRINLFSKKHINYFYKI